MKTKHYITDITCGGCNFAVRAVASSILHQRRGVGEPPKPIAKLLNVYFSDQKHGMKKITKSSRVEEAEQFAKETGCPLENLDVMVSIGLGGQYESGKTIADKKGLGEYPRTDIGEFVLAIVNIAMLHTLCIKSMTEEAKDRWSRLVLRRHSVGFRLQQMENFERSVSHILRAPAEEQRPLADEYNKLSAEISQIESQPGPF